MYQTTDTAVVHSAHPAVPAVPEAERRARLELCLAVDVVDVWLGRLLEDHPPSTVLAAIREERVTRLPLNASAREARTVAHRAERYRARLEWCKVGEVLAATEAAGARFVVPGDPWWPDRFDELGPQRPIGVWMAGDPTRLDPAVSIVGARACTSYGEYVASTLGAELAERGVTVVSGAALGVDAAAHRGALAVGGATVAVLACGVDVAYPRAHDALLHAIRERGAVVTELQPGARPTRFTFLQRNRLIAALGRATVVVEAARRSGSLVTARQAAELGRAVLAVPGPVTSEQSQGTHALIRDGATLVTCAEQVQEACDEGAAGPEPRDGPADCAGQCAGRNAPPAEPAGICGAAD
ncbi:MAG TPA: DNA-processing protein DprA [Actinocrinis sp.]|jgi:DNA processing protein